MQGHTAEKKKKKRKMKQDTQQPLRARNGVRACYSARTNDRNVIIGTAAATCNERGSMENIPKTKRKGLMRQAERETWPARRIKKVEGNRKKEKEREQPLSAISNVVAM